MLQTAHDALARRDAAAALSAARALLEAEPDRADAHHALGLALQLAGQAAEAADAFARATDLDAEHAGYALALASLAVNLRQFERADQALAEALRRDPNSLPAYAMSAHLSIGRGQLDQAEQQLRRAERIADGHPLTLCMQGNLALARGQHAVAQKALHDAAQRAPQDPLILSSLALAYVGAGNHAFAEQTLRRALELDPSAVQLRRLLIDSLRQQQRIEDLPEAIEQLLAQQPGDWVSLAQLADCQLLLEQREPALDALRRLLAMPALPAGALDAVLQVLGRHGELDAARELLDAHLQANPQDESLWQRRFGLGENDMEQVEQFIARWLEAQPGSAHARQAQAGLLEMQGALQAAEASADTALLAAPDLLSATLIKLRAEVRQAPESALARIDRLLARQPLGEFKAVLLRLRAFTLDRLQRAAEAVQSMRAAAEANEEPTRLPAAPPMPEGSAAADPSLRPRLLWGAPGSHIEALAHALRSVPELHVLDDRFGGGARPDGLWPPRQDGAITDSRGWAEMLGRVGFLPDQVVDWLPFWDVRIAAAMPAARLLVALDDPRNLLLNWQVFGARLGPAPAPEVAAEWLAIALEPLALRVEAKDADVCVVDGAATRDAPAAVAERAQAFFELAEPLDPKRLEAGRIGLGGLPMAFDPGHWRAYAEPLAAAFARLQPVAVRLGYPAD